MAAWQLGVPVWRRADACGGVPGSRRAHARSRRRQEERLLRGRRRGEKHGRRLWMLGGERGDHAARRTSPRAPSLAGGADQGTLATMLRQGKVGSGSRAASAVVAAAERRLPRGGGALVGVALITPTSLANSYAIESLARPRRARASLRRRP